MVAVGGGGVELAFLQHLSYSLFSGELTQLCWKAKVCLSAKIFLVHYEIVVGQIRLCWPPTVQVINGNTATCNKMLHDSGIDQTKTHCYSCFKNALAKSVGQNSCALSTTGRSNMINCCTTGRVGEKPIKPIKCGGLWVHDILTTYCVLSSSPTVPITSTRIKTARKLQSSSFLLDLIGFLG